MCKTSLFFILPLLLIITGCNNDIFIDRDELPTDMEATIAGDGGETVLTIPCKELDNIQFDLYSDMQKYCTYYNSKGDIINRNSPASEVNRIVFDNDRTRQILERDGNRFIFKSISNSLDTLTRIIRLEYEYTVRNITITVLPGEKLELFGVYYSDLKEGSEVKTRKTGFFNDTPLPQTFNEMPLANTMFTINVQPRLPYSWVETYTVTIPVPVYENGKWIMAERSLTPGTPLFSYRTDNMTIVPVDIPPYAKVNIFTDITYSLAEADGTMVFRNPVLDRQIPVDFTVRCSYPESYEIRVEDAN